MKETHLGTIKDSNGNDRCCMTVPLCRLLSVDMFGLLLIDTARIENVRHSWIYMHGHIRWIGETRTDELISESIVAHS